VLFSTVIATLAQSNPTTFTNTNQPNAEPTTSSFTFHMHTEDGRPVGTCPPNSAGCVIYFNSPFITVTLPDIPDAYANHDTLTCTIKGTVVTGTYRCTTAKCQSVTYTATGDNDNDTEKDSDSDDSLCRDATGKAWTLVTTQYYHWIHVGRRYIRYYDGGNGTLSH